MSTCKRVHPDAAPKPKTAFDCIARLRNEECLSDAELVKPGSKFNNRLASRAVTLFIKERWLRQTLLEAARSGSKRLGGAAIFKKLLQTCMVRALATDERSRFGLQLYYRDTIPWFGRCQ